MNWKVKYVCNFKIIIVYIIPNDKIMLNDNVYYI